MSSWGWKNRRVNGLRDYMPRWVRPLSVAVPWITVGLLFILIEMLGGVFTSAEGALFALPDAQVADVSSSSMVSLLLPTPQGTVVFFDDTRYVLDDEVQMNKFAEQVKGRLPSSEDRTLLALADVRVRNGDLLRFAGLAKRAGVRQILFAEKKGAGSFE